MRRRSVQLLRVVALVGLGGGVGGCSGLLVMSDPETLKSCSNSSECDDKYVCDSTTSHCALSKGPCSKAIPDGDCGPDYLCVSGSCLCYTDACCPDGTDDCTKRCDLDPPTETCSIDQYCASSGKCEALPTEVCTPLTPNAPCANGGDCCESGNTCCASTERCVAGGCVPILQECSQQYPTGLCPSGFYCIGGKCHEIGETCDTAHPTSPCADPSEVCQGGTCVTRPCAVGQIGPCPIDYTCDIVLGQCVQLPCSIDHPTGSCPSPSTQRCSHAGSCINNGTCLVRQDCLHPDQQYCSSDTKTCLSNGTCDSDSDCGVDQPTTYGPAYVCNASDRCVARTFPCDDDTAPCISTQFCSTVSSTCLDHGKCAGTPDCATGNYCGTAGSCLADGTCEQTADCLLVKANTFCGGPTTPKRCYDVGQCFSTAVPAEDCPPNNSCSSDGITVGTCSPVGAGQCSSNTFTNVGCPGGTLSCCATGGTCCDSLHVCNLTQHNCVPYGQCVGDADCLSGTHCVGYWCVPNNTDCNTCNPTTEQCSSWKIQSGVDVSGCISKGRCMANANCAAGEVCDASNHCVASPLCGHETMAVGGAIQPNVLVVVDRSGSMNICGPANSVAAPCGFSSGACTSSTCAGGTNAGLYCNQPSDCPGGTCGAGGCTGAGETCFSVRLCSAGSTSGICSGGTSPGSACDLGGAACPGAGATCRPKTCTQNTSCGTSGVCTPQPNAGTCWNPSCTYGMCTNDGACTTDASCTTPGDVCYYPGRCVGGSNAGNVCGTTAECTGGTCGISSCVGGANNGLACLLSTDCPSGTCTPASGQGFCTSPTCITPRWSQAESAIKYVTDTYRTRINFGLAVFPRAHRPCTTSYDCVQSATSVCTNPSGLPLAGTCSDVCTQSCRFNTCTGGGNLLPGVVDVPIAPGADQNAQQVAILDALAATAPGGSTPTGPTLRGIAGRSDYGGLAATDRANAVLLVTDGEATGDTGTVKVCAPPCADGAKDGDESDSDCGGSCNPCVDGKSCSVADDCASRICRVGVCRATTCGNDALDGGESDKDCGGACGPCADGKVCAGAADCASKLCVGGTCAVPTCSDGQQNGDETDVDCGGGGNNCASPNKCITGKKCVVAADCVDAVCQAGVCRPATCGNGTISSGETDIDCGGTTCGPCQGGQTCASGTDCVGGLCNGTKHWCESPGCADGRKDGNETGVDCGGSECGPCDAAAGCVVNLDCKSGICDTATTHLCVAPNCGDGVRNGDETGTDCGGTCATCGNTPGQPACANAAVPVTTNKACTAFGYNTTCTGDSGCASGACIRGYCTTPCKVDGDCASGTCQRGVCAAAHCTNVSKDSTETGTDCGGPDCPPCAGCGSACATNTCSLLSYGDSDCLSGRCNGGKCADPVCNDSVKNGAETDVDCGGTCAGCAVGKGCSTGIDCATGICETGRCQPARCGGTLDKCKPFQICASDGDCLGGVGSCKDYTDGTGLSTTKQPDLVNAAIGHLYGSTPKVKTFVIGFNLGSTSKNLNCHAVYGRTARKDQGSCATRTAADCANETSPCYYDANDQTSLQTAFQDIVKAVASCTYDLSVTTLAGWPYGYYVYLEEGAARTRVDQFSSWTVQGSRLEFFGTACAKIQSGAAAPLVIKRCPEGG